MDNKTLDSEDSGARLLLVALAGCVLFHGGLLPFTHANTYDAFIHMFFGDHYHRNWFDPWEPRWYTGFATTSYPPGTHMMIAALLHLMPLRAAFVVVQLLGLILLTIGTYRFSLLWVPARAAGYAAITLVLSSSIAETVHLFGQLPTIFSLGVFLNGMPYVYRWIVLGGWRNFLAAVIFGAATTAAHHVTTLFGAVLFIVPLALQALRAVAELNPLRVPRPSGSQGLDQLRAVFAGTGRFRHRLRRLTRFGWPFARGLLLAVALVAAMVTTIFPYWYWSITDPITQVPIPHGSRESFVLRPDLGLIFFLLPWGTSLLLLPYALYKGATSRLWPLGASLLLCFVLGTGGTTPLPRMILRGAFDILTLDRFTFWASILILPFVGLMFDGLLHGRSGRLVTAALGRGVRRMIVGGLFASYVAVAVFCAVLPVIRPTQPAFIDPAPIVNFLGQDQHDQWRYLTLGFGDQFAYVSAMTTAQSVDGNYHSARRLPDMMRYSVERLENAKYLGVPGLGSLQQFLVNTDRYHLKYVFSNDAFYDPLLTFSGWNQLNRLQNGIVVWEKPDVQPLPRLQPRQHLGAVQSLMWGALPPLALLLAGMIFAGSVLRRGFARAQVDYRPVIQPQISFVRPAMVRRVVLGLAGGALIAGLALAATLWRAALAPLPPEQVLAAYFDDLDFRRHDAAYARLDPHTRPSLQDAMFRWRWQGGLIASYGKLVGFKADPVRVTADLIDWKVSLDWLTALDTRHVDEDVRTVRRDGHWYLVPSSLRPTQTPVRLQRQAEAAWNVTGRRQPRPEADPRRDQLDRPDIAISGARLVRHDGLYSVVGLAMNADADPAFLTLHAVLRDDAGRNLAGQQAAVINGQRLLPAESTGFRIAFEGVLSLQDAALTKGFDPKLFIPPILTANPVAASLDARTLVAAANLYRGIALNGVTEQETSEGLLIRGMAVNTGIRTASVIRVLALLYDAGAKPIWADAGFVDTNILPGQSSPFSLLLPRCDAVAVVAEIGLAETEVNGLGATDAQSASPGATDGTIPLQGVAGCSALRLQVSTMTYDPEF